jgi:hypothetical protein
MMPGSSICELCQFEETGHVCGHDHAPVKDNVQPCQVCGNTSGVRSIGICGGELLVCSSCTLDYFAADRAFATC